MIDPATAKQVADAGGWAAFLILCGLLAVSFHRGWIVPGWVWKIERARSDKLVEQLERNTDALRRLAAFVGRPVKRDRPERPDAAP